MGRFMPPHNGHRYLIEFARRFADRVTVLVCTLAHEPIPGALRYQWVRELFPDLNVVHVTEEIPEASRSNPRAHEIWAAFIRQRLRKPLQYVFASETYGAPLAAELGARFIPVDPARSNFPISATVIRQNPADHWRHIPGPVRPYYQHRVCLLGGASNERGELAISLAAEFNTLAVPDMRTIRGELLEVGGTGTYTTELQRSQHAAEAALARQAGPLLVCTTDALVIALSAPPEYETGRAAERASEPAAAHLYLLLPESAASPGPAAATQRSETHTVTGAPTATQRTEAQVAAQLHSRGARVEQLPAATTAAAVNCVRRSLHNRG